MDYSLGLIFVQINWFTGEMEVKEESDFQNYHITSKMSSFINVHLPHKLWRTNKTSNLHHSIWRKYIVFCIMYLYNIQYKLYWHKWMNTQSQRWGEHKVRHACHWSSSMPRLVREFWAAHIKAFWLSLVQHEPATLVFHEYRGDRPVKCKELRRLEQ